MILNVCLWSLNLTFCDCHSNFSYTKLSALQNAYSSLALAHAALAVVVAVVVLVAVVVYHE